MTAMVLTRNGAGSSAAEGAAVPAPAPVIVTAAGAAAGPSQAPVTLEAMQGLIEGLKREIRAEVRAEVGAALAVKRPLSDRASRARAPEGFKWRREAHELRYNSLVRAVEPLEELEAALEDARAANPTVGEDWVGLLATSMDRIYEIMKEFRMGDEHGWAVVARLKTMDRELTDEEQKWLKKAKKQEQEAKDASARKKQDAARQKATKRDLTGRAKWGDVHGNSYNRTGRPVPYCKNCRIEGHWPDHCPNPPYRQTRHG